MKPGSRTGQVLAMKPYASSLAAILWLGVSWTARAEPPKNLASSIITEGVAARVLNTEVEADVANAQSDFDNAKTLISHCAYRGKDSRTNAAHVDVLLRQSESADIAKEQFDGAKAVYRGKDVAGIGDAAFRTTLPAQLHILKGRVWVIVTAGTFKADPALEEEVAQIVLKRLPG